jgi:hypothetical protein
LSNESIRERIEDRLREAEAERLASRFGPPRRPLRSRLAGVLHAVADRLDRPAAAWEEPRLKTIRP